MAGYFTLTCQGNVRNLIVQPLSLSLKRGKWYWEVCIPHAGMISSNVIRTIRTGVFSVNGDVTDNLGDFSASYAWRADGKKWAAGTSAHCHGRLRGKYGVMTVALDLNEKRLWFGANGKWFKGNPETGLSPTYLLTGEEFVPAVSSFHGGAGGIQVSIPSTSELLCFPPPSGFSALEPGYHDILPVPIILSSPQVGQKDEVRSPKIPERILSKLDRCMTWVCWKVDGVWNRMVAKRTVTPPIWQANHPGHRVYPKPMHAPRSTPENAIKDLPNTPIEKMIDNRVARHQYFMDLSDNMLAKGNFFMAFKLARQADACSPLLSGMQVHLQWLESLRSIGLQFDPALGQKIGKEPSLTEGLFDFVFVPTEKCGSTAHLTMLSIHPGSTVPTNAETQSAFYHENEGALLTHFMRNGFRRETGVLSGLVMDARISGARQQPSGIVTGPEFARRLSKIVRPNGFFQAIRHPFGIVKSTYNSNILLNDLGAYSFSYTNPNTLFCGDTIDVETFEVRASHFVRASHEISKINKRTLRDQMEFAVRIPRPYSVGKAHFDFFDSWNIIDLDQKIKREGVSRMAESYSSLGIDPNFTHPLDEIPYRDKTHFTMQRNHLKIRVYGAEMRITLGRALQTICTNDDNMIELAWTQPSEEAHAVGLCAPLCLAVDRNDWVSLSPELKYKIVDSEILSHFLINALLPLWLHDYKIWHDAVSPNLIREFDAHTKDKIISCSGNEFIKFLNEHPDVESSWQDLTKVL